VERVLIAIALVVVAVVVAYVLQRRKPDAPSAPKWQIPAQLDRQDFRAPQAEWLVAVFTSSTCDTCAEVMTKIMPLDGGEHGPVVVEEIEYHTQKDRHKRYGIEAIPLVVIADRQGVVVQHYLGPINAADVWAEIAQLRDETTND
jgi:hypothetical protein